MADCLRGLLSEAKSNQRLTVKLWEIHAHTTTCIKCVQKASLTLTSYEVRLPDRATQRLVHVVPSFSVIVLKIHTPPPWLLSVCVCYVWVFCLCTQSASDGTSSEETARQCRNTMRLQLWGLLGFCSPTVSEGLLLAQSGNTFTTKGLEKVADKLWPALNHKNKNEQHHVCRNLVTLKTLTQSLFTADGK